MTDPPGLQDAATAIHALRHGGGPCESIARAALEAAAPHIAAAERERLFVAIRHGIGRDITWRGAALDLLADLFAE